MLDWYAISGAVPCHAELIRRAKQERSNALRSIFRLVGRQFGAGVRELINLATGLKRRHAATATITSLSVLDDAILKDIGVRRTDIPGLARALASGDRHQFKADAVADPTAGMRLVVDNAGSTHRSPEPVNTADTDVASPKAA